MWEVPYQVSIHIQDGIDLLHTTTGLPWWVSIGVSTLAVRTVLLPVARTQIMLSEKFSLAVRDMVGVAHLFRAHVGSRSEQTGTLPVKIAMEELPKLIKSINDVNLVHGTSFSGIMLPTILNAGVFITFIMSVRWMMHEPQFVRALQEGGAWWFVDLTTKDKSIYLPLVASLINYFSLELFFQKKSSDLGLKIKDGIQMFIIVTFAAIVDLPSGVFMYWIPSGIFTIAQRYLFANNTTRKMMGMGPVQIPPEEAIINKDGQGFSSVTTSEPKSSVDNS